MFSKLLAIGCVQYTSEAVRIIREPLLAKVGGIVDGAAKGPDHPIDYFVPNFGADRDIQTTQRNLSTYETKFKHQLTTEGPVEASIARDYFVPNFGADRDIQTTQKNLAAYEKKFKHQLSLEGPKEADIPRDYFVPNFGQDRDIITTQKNLSQYEKKFKHQLTTEGPKEADIPRDYFIPNFGQDRDIITTQKNLKTYEGKFKHQLSVVGPKESDIPKDYFIPDFGMDRDIVTTQKNLKDQEAVHGVWAVPQENVQLWMTREPLMSIVDEVPKGELNYGKVANFGQDAEISETLQDLSESEKQSGITWNPQQNNGHYELPSSQIEFELLQQGANLRREGYRPPTLEDLKPKVIEVLQDDDDVQDSAQSLAESEKEMGIKLSVPKREYGQALIE